MVIAQFNKLIRNKWVWGVFAVAVSAAFCFDDLFTSREREEASRGSSGMLNGKSVPAPEFNMIADDLRGLGRNRDWKKKASEINLQAWQTLAALRVAEKNGMTATDAEVQETIRHDRSFAPNGQFSFDAYQMILRENGLTPEHFEAFMKRQLTLQHLADSVLGSATWVSPTELDQAVADMTDKFTVRVASFTQKKEDADKVALDDAGLRKWYDENAKSLALPERVKLRMVRYSATDTNVLAKMTVTDDAMHDYFDANSEKYTKLGTNGTDRVDMTFDEAKPQIEKELRRIAAIEYYETNLNVRAYGVKAAKGASRLDEIAKEDGATVVTTDWFATDGGYVEGFMRPASSICLGVEGFESAVAELDLESEDLRYGVVSSANAVWLIEKKEVSAAHTPTFDEAKEIVRPRALEVAKEEAFKTAVNAIAAKGTNVVLATANVSTNFTFSVSDREGPTFPNQYAVMSAATKLAKGEVSEFFRTGRDTAILVVCIDREPGDATKAAVVREDVRNQVAMLARRQIPEAWQKWNLERLGFEPGEGAYVKDSEESEE